MISVLHSCCMNAEKQVLNAAVPFHSRYAKTLVNTGKIQYLQGQKKKAADGNRTRDLRTTNATLYLLSYNSTSRLPEPRYIISQAGCSVNQNLTNLIKNCQNYFKIQNLLQKLHPNIPECFSVFFRQTFPQSRQ